jgi:hypothetical protein
MGPRSALPHCADLKKVLCSAKFKIGEMLGIATGNIVYYSVKMMELTNKQVENPEHVPPRIVLHGI